MNVNRARDIFSDYYEGLADDHSRKVFERAIAQDAALREEYEAFVQAIESMSALSNETIDVPADLHETISARIDKHVWEKSQTTSRKVFGLPNWAFGGLAVAAIAVALVAIVKRPMTGPAGTPAVAGSGIGLLNSAPVKASFAYVGGKINLQVSSDQKLSVTVKRTDTDEVVKTYSIAGRGTQIDAPLINNTADPVALTVKLSTGSSMFIVLPGTTRTEALSGDGDLFAVAMAVAGHFGTPVVLTPPDAMKSYHWEFQAKDTASDLPQRLTSSGLSVELMESGLLRLSNG